MPVVFSVVLLLQLFMYSFIFWFGFFPKVE